MATLKTESTTVSDVTDMTDGTTDDPERQEGADASDTLPRKEDTGISKHILPKKLKVGVSKDLIPYLSKLKTKDYINIMDKSAKPSHGLAGKILHFPGFESFMAIIIIFNLVVMVVDIDQAAADEDVAGDDTHWTDIIGWTTLFIFVAELALRRIALKRAFWNDRWNTCDFAIVATDSCLSLMGLIFDNVFPVSVLRIFRLAKLARASNILRVFPELRLLLAGLVSSMSVIFWGMLLLSFFLLIWSMVAVLFIHPLNKDVEYDYCERCPRAYSTVMHSTLTMWQQIIAGDSWGRTTIPLIEKHPSTAVFFISVYLSVGMGVVNLILGVVVSVAQQAKEDIVSDQKLEFALVKLESQARLLELCRQMDTDGSGELSMEEIVGGFAEEGEFRDNMLAMDITKEDLEIAWAILDSDGSGSLSYKEFVTQLYTMRSSDTQFMLAYIKYYITEIRSTLKNEIRSHSMGTEYINRAVTEELRKFQDASQSIEKAVSMGRVINEIHKFKVEDERILTNGQMDPQSPDKDKPVCESQGSRQVTSTALLDERLTWLTHASHDLGKSQAELRSIIMDMSRKLSHMAMHEASATAKAQPDLSVKSGKNSSPSLLHMCCKISASGDRLALAALPRSAMLESEIVASVPAPKATPSLVTASS